jgi:hypothetical protein
VTGPDDAGFWPVISGRRRQCEPPVLTSGGGAEAHHFIFDKEGHHLRQSYGFFLAVSESVTVFLRQAPSRF